MSEPQSSLEAAGGQPAADNSPLAATLSAPSSASQPTETLDVHRGLGQSLPHFSVPHRRLLQRCTAAMLTVLALQWVFIATQRPDPVLLQRGDSFRRQFRLDINTATWVEWLQLEGIGPSLAHRIVAERKLNGRFVTIDDVGRVPGIGPATLDRIRPWLTISHDLSEPQLPATISSPPLKPSADARSIGRAGQQPARNDRKPPAF
jgi:competence protein ComEA